MLIAVLSVHGYPLNGHELDSAVDGVQKYLESSGFPKMTRGEVLDFFNDFSRNARVSRSGNTVNDNKFLTTVTPQTNLNNLKTYTPHMNSTSQPNITNKESPLNYGYPMSINKQIEKSSSESTTPIIFVTVQDRSPKSVKNLDITLPTTDGRNTHKKSIGPPIDLNAYNSFKKIPEAKDMKIDDDMKSFFNQFGLLDSPKSGRSINLKEAQKRNDDFSVTESVDKKLLESILVETSNNNSNGSKLQPFIESISSRDHVFNPTDSNIKTIDVNRIAKIVENIRLLADDNNTITLPQDVIQKKLENITAAITAIDQPTDNKVFNGYEVFFDDNSKEIDSDLPDTPTYINTESHTLNTIKNAPDPLSSDELQQFVEKNKSDIKRQEPVNETSSENSMISTEESVTLVSTDSSSEATSVEVTSDSNSERDLSSTATADTKPSLSELAESFGGGETASSPPPTNIEDTPSNRPKSGLYFYVDWNSFLTVNEGQKNQINLRFAPKAGNPAHFLRVTVP